MNADRNRMRAMTGLRLSAADRRMLDGSEGSAVQHAMRVVTRMAGIQNAEELTDISRVHIGGSIYTGDGSLGVIERLAREGGKVRVPTTINSISVDRKRWKAQRIDKHFAEQAERLASGFESMGAEPIFSCTPYVFPDTPKFGDDIVWAESNAIVYANSVIGAHTNRNGDFFDICAALTGRAPLTGLHLQGNRYGQMLVRVPPLDGLDDSFFSVLGYLIGERAGSMIPVIDGLRERPSADNLKALCSTVATSGAVAMFHIVGVTPEAGSLDAAFGGREPSATLTVTEDDLWRVWQELSTGEGSSLDVVAMGSPHFSVSECSKLAGLVGGQHIKSGVDFLITTNRLVYGIAQREGWADAIERFGARFSTDTCLCMLNDSMFADTARTMMTNSGKFAHYGPGNTGRGVYFGSMGDCVRSAVSGRVSLAGPAWLAAR